jgi:hypothetical protein
MCSGLFMRFAWMVQPRNYLLLACHAANESVQVALLLSSRRTCLSLLALCSQDVYSKRNFGGACCIRRRILISRTYFLLLSGPQNRKLQPAALRHRNDHRRQNHLEEKQTMNANFRTFMGQASTAATIYGLGAAASAGAAVDSAACCADTAAA